MALPPRTGLDVQQTWSTFLTWLKALWDHIATLPHANTARGAWATGQSYAVNDYMVEAGATYVCMLTHTSGVFATDLAAGNWALFDNTALRADLIDGTNPAVGSGQVAYNDALTYPVGTIGGFVKTSIPGSVQAAQAARDAALIQAGVYPTEPAGRSKGVMQLTSFVGGTGAPTPGTFALGFSGGSGTGAAGYFIVAGGIVTTAVITHAGYNYTSAPTVSFAAASPSTASATAVIDYVVAEGEAFKVQGSGGVAAYEYRVNTGRAASTLIAIYPSSASIDTITSQISQIGAPDYAVAFTDSADRVAGGILNDGTFVIADLAIDSLSPALLNLAGTVQGDTTSDPNYFYAITDSLGRICFGIKNTGEVSVGKITALEADIASGAGPSLASIGSYYGLTPVTLTNSYAVGDSTVAAYLGGTAILDLVTSTRIKTTLAVPGHTIAQQKTVWQATTITPLLAGYVVVQVGLNDLVPAEAATVAIARLQDLITTIRTSIGASRPLLIAQMSPCRQRLVDLYGATDGPIAYTKWQDINTAIGGGGGTPITGVDGRITAHVALMGDGSGNLAVAYDTGDHVHTNTAGRQVAATAWTNALNSLGIVP